MQAEGIVAKKIRREYRQLSVRIPTEEYRQLERAAKADGVTPGAWARARFRSEARVAAEQLEMMLAVVFAAELVGEFLRAAQDETEGRTMSDEGLRQEMERRAAERSFGTLDRAQSRIKKLSGESASA